MKKELKPIVEFDETLGLLDIRVGRVVEVEIEPNAAKPSYKLLVDFGRFGKKVSVARLTDHAVEELKDSLVLGVLNFPSRVVGKTESEVLVLGVQYPKMPSGNATPVSPAVKGVKIGSKLF